MNAALARSSPHAGRGIDTLSRIVFWEPCVSPHKSAFIEAVAEQFGASVEVICVAHEDVPQARQALGWTSGQPSGAGHDGAAGAQQGQHLAGNMRHRTIVAPPDALIERLVTEHGQDALHVFSGIRWFSTITRALAVVRRCSSPFAVMSEPRDNAGMKGAARFVQSWVTEGWLRRNAQFVLAIGRHGPDWFHSVGYRPHRVFPFAYFLPAVQDVITVAAEEDDTRSAEAAPGTNGDEKIEVAYVGRLIEQKGVRYLLDAMATLSPRARLTLIGDGDLREALVSRATGLNLDVEFTGARPIDEVQRRMRAFDVLVLPSLTKDDGWGAVVTEALLAGTAAIASSCAGASILLDDPRNGCVVPPRDSGAIARAITDLEREGALSRDARAARMQWAVPRLTARAGASHFMQIVRHRWEGGPRPTEFYR
jgi:glycosyltransferase involved in cell wall biosynthesis